MSGYRVFGANTDVRPPTPTEEWKGGVVWFECGPDNRPMDQMRRVTLALDGVFFSDGEFAGLNDTQLYERIVCDAEAYQKVAAVARERFESGAAAHHILEAVETITGPVHHRPPPPPPPPSGRKTDIEELRLQARRWLAWNIAATRQTDGDEKAVLMLVS